MDPTGLLGGLRAPDKRAPVRFMELLQHGGDAVPEDSGRHAECWEGREAPSFEQGSALTGWMWGAPGKKFHATGRRRLVSVHEPIVERSFMFNLMADLKGVTLLEKGF